MTDASAASAQASGLKTIGVVGCGLMGGGIAQVCAAAGYTTVVREVNDDLLGRGIGRIQGILGNNIDKGRTTREEADALLKRLKPTTNLEDLADCDIVIEAIIENMDEKRKLFAALDSICKPETIFSSNTSSLMIIEMAAATKRADRVGGTHFFNPVPMMKLVEVVQTIATSEQTLATLRTFGEVLGKKVVIAKDTPGFIVNTLLVPYLLDAIRMLEHGFASRDDIDAGMKLGCNYPMGPFELLDFIGLDTTYYIANIMFDEYREARFAPPSLLKQMVLAGQYGKKTGKGFYDYSSGKPK